MHTTAAAGRIAMANVNPLASPSGVKSFVATKAGKGVEGSAKLSTNFTKKERMFKSGPKKKLESEC